MTGQNTVISQRIIKTRPNLIKMRTVKSQSYYITDLDCQQSDTIDAQWCESEFIYLFFVTDINNCI